MVKLILAAVALLCIGDFAPSTLERPGSASEAGRPAEVSAPESGTLAVKDLVDGAGAPYTRRGSYDRRLVAKDGSRTRINSIVEVTRGGRFVAGFYEPPLKPGMECTLEVSFKPEGNFSTSSDRKRIALHDVVIPPYGEPKDVGDLILKGGLPQIEGRVVDSDGTPATSVAVYLYDQEQGKPPGHWARRIDLHGTTGRDGRFSLSVADPAVPRAIQAVGFDGLLSPLLALESSSSSPVLKLGRTVDVAGRVVLPEGMTPTSLKVLIAASDQAHLAVCDARLTADGEFLLEGVLPSTVDLALVRYGRLEPYARLRGVRISDDTPDPSIMPWDLSELLQFVECQVILPGGNGNERISAVVERCAFSAQEGKVALLVEDPESLITIRSDGYREHRCRIHELGFEVTLRRALSVELKVEASGAGAAACQGILVSLLCSDARSSADVAGDARLGDDEWVEAMSRARFNPSASLEPNGTVTLPVHRSGEFRLRFSRRAGKKGERPISEEDLPEALSELRALRINVQDRPGPQPILVTIL